MRATELSPRRRIAFLTWRDTDHPDGGGSEVYVESVARGLVGRGHHVTILCAEHGDAPRDQVIEGVRVRRRGGRLTVYLHGLLFLLSREGRRQDLVVDVINGLPFAAPLVRRRGLVALVHHVHREQWRIIYPGRWGRLGWFCESRITPRLYRRVPHITVSEASRADLHALGVSPELVTLIHNGTPPSFATPVPLAATPRLCVLSRLVPHKRVEDAVDVLAALARDVPGIELDIIGDGWWAQRVQARVDELGVSEGVTMHGHVDEPTKAALLDAAWLMLLPSVKEGWGIAILEAASHRTPTIAYQDAGGVNESIRDGQTGVLVRDVEEMTASARSLLTNPDRLARMGERAQENARLYTWDEAVQEFERMLEKFGAVTDRM